MTLWRLEWLRLTRTSRWLALGGVFVFFGAIGPLTARYMEQILGQVGGDVQITFPAPQPVDGIAQYVSNVSQLGVLVVLIVAAGALAFDARPEAAAFFRTRVHSSRQLVLPRYAVTTAASFAAWALGGVLAWFLTVVLIGAPSAGGVVVGLVYGGIYLAFAVSVVAAMAGITSSVVATVLGAVTVMLVLPVLGVVDAIEPWLPSELVGATVALAGGASAGDFARAVSVAVVATVVLVAVAVGRIGAREL